MDTTLDPDFDLVRLLGKKPTRKYSRDEMQLLRDRPASLIYPEELKPKVMPSTYKSNLWDPEVWWMSLMDKKESLSSTTRASNGIKGPGDKRKHSRAERGRNPGTQQSSRSPSPMIGVPRLWTAPGLHHLLAPVHSPLLGYTAINHHWAASSPFLGPTSSYVPWDSQEALRTCAALAQLPGTAQPTYHLDVGLPYTGMEVPPRNSYLDSTMTPPRTTLAPSGNYAPYQDPTAQPALGIPRKGTYQEEWKGEIQRKGSASRNLKFSSEKESKIHRIASALAKLLVVEKDKAVWLYQSAESEEEWKDSAMTWSQNFMKSYDHIQEQINNWKQAWSSAQDSNFSRAPGTPLEPPAIPYTWGRSGLAESLFES